jgi:sulfatase maturation enzyme AslB (radical SAM superfamily)
MELRESNLCNFACRMCNANDSIVIEREIKANPELQQFFSLYDEKPTTNENWNQILELTKDVESINLTGGEPMLMKRYHQLLDHLISTSKENIALNVYTNGSVYNSLFLEKLIKFPNAKLIFSIDAVGKIAEYQRYGGSWKTVHENILKCAELPIKMRVHSTITAYSILGVSELSDFFVELSDKNFSNFQPFTAHVARNPSILEIVNLNVDLRIIAIKKIDSAVTKLANDKLFANYIKELLSVKKQLMIRKDCNFIAFTNMTKALDKVRKQSFEDTFGYKI